MKLSTELPLKLADLSELNKLRYMCLTPYNCLPLKTYISGDLPLCNSISNN